MHFRSLVPICCVVLLLAACNDDESDAPNASPVALTMSEDTSASGALLGADPRGEPLWFSIEHAPGHGRVEVEGATGRFTYTPDPDFFGNDSFSFSVRNSRSSSLPALVTISIDNVNDPPTLGEIPDLGNSPDTETVSYPLDINDIDGDTLTIQASTADSTVATASVEQVAGAPMLHVLSANYGQTTVTVSVSDGQYTATRTALFTVQDVTKHATVAVSSNEAIALANNSNAPAVFTLKHNDFPLFQSEDEMLKYVQAMPEDFAGEPFERKLWRFVRDNVYHAVPLTNAQWLYDSWVTANSLGWGFCGHVAALYVRLARAAGYAARVWGLNGHVVPEIQVAGRWEMFDPDLAVYYRNREGDIAGVEELAADPTLITAPNAPIIPPNTYSTPYSALIADFYGTPDNNFDGEEIFLAIEPAVFQTVNLPAGATLVYPGRWTSSVTGIDGADPYPVPYYLQAALTTSSNWVGELSMPWMVWEIRGTGRVAIDDLEFDAGSPELLDYIQHATKQIRSVRVMSADSPLTFIFFINAMRYDLNPQNALEMSGKDVWRLSVGTQQLSPTEAVTVGEKTIYQKVKAAIP